MNRAFKVQGRVRGPWRKFLDALAPERPALHRYCCKLTGNVWDGEDLAQDTLMRVFSLLGKVDAQLDNPQAYLVRTATNLWIDRMRRLAREHALAELTLQEEHCETSDPARHTEVRDAARDLLQRLHPQERAAVVLKDVFDYSLEETASLLKTTVGAVKGALHRARGRMDAKLPKAEFGVPGRELVAAFMRALADKDMAALQRICAADLTVELVGGAEMNSFEQSRSFFKYAHMSMPALGFGIRPRWELADYHGEPVIIGFRTSDGVEGINEIHRIESADGVVTRVRSYCFCPDTLQMVADELGLRVVRRLLAYRSPSLPDVPRLLIRHVFKRQKDS